MRGHSGAQPPLLPRPLKAIPRPRVRRPPWARQHFQRPGRRLRGCLLDVGARRAAKPSRGRGPRLLPHPLRRNLRVERKERLLFLPQPLTATPLLGAGRPPRGRQQPRRPKKWFRIRLRGARAARRPDAAAQGNSRHRPTRRRGPAPVMATPVPRHFASGCACQPPWQCTWSPSQASRSCARFWTDIAGLWAERKCCQTTQAACTFRVGEASP